VIGWNSVSTASKIRLARALYRGVIGIRAIARLPPIVVAQRRGVRFELDLAEGIDLAMYLGGAFEFDTYRALRRLIKEGDTVLDVGANAGIHTLPLARMVGARGTVIAFEPTNAAFRRLVRNLELNPDLSGRVKPVMAYLDDRGRGDAAPREFYASWRLDIARGQHPKHFGSLEVAGNARAWTLDAYSSAMAINRVAVMKLDVDGFEYKVLRGGVGLLARDRPAIVAEVCPYALEEQGSSAEEMLGLLTSLGYSFYDERTLQSLSGDPKIIAASVKRNSSINIVALAGSRATAPSGTSVLDERFHESQRRFFDTADTQHFFWQTGNPYVARTERELLRGISIAALGKVLEVGCGEGGNIANALSATAAETRVVGLDLFEPKIRFAKRLGVRASFVCGDALTLPFQDATFDLVLCRDVLHHVSDRERALSELRRVCKQGGIVWILEPNGWNPLMRLLALVRPHERGLLRNSLSTLRRLVSAHFPAAQFDVRQPMPIYRLILHYQFGIPSLGRHPAFAFAMDVCDAIARRAVPRAFWAYVVITADV
jgi:FkbM family methyltransferase